MYLLSAVYVTVEIFIFFLVIASFPVLLPILVAFVAVGCVVWFYLISLVVGSVVRSPTSNKKNGDDS